MILTSLIILVVLFCSHGVFSTEEGVAYAKGLPNDKCYTDKTVTGERQIVKVYKEDERKKISWDMEQIKVYCNPDIGFEGIEIILYGRLYSRNEVVFKADELGIVPDSKWYDLTITFSYNRQDIVRWGWYINISIAEGNSSSQHVNTATVGSALTTMELVALGPSSWNFRQTDGHCSTQSEQQGIIPWIILGVLLPLLILTIVILVYIIKHQKNSHLPQVSFNASNSQIETRNGNGQNRRFGRPGSYNSINSLYGVI